jgi:asparagine synthase (glutamine-hydrolysing)
MFDVLRSDKSISTHGLEPRTPFLDRAWTQYYLSIPPQYRYKPGLMGFHPHYQYIEKFLVRLAFSKEYYSETELLPEKILWRTKEAFSDGVSSQQKSLFMIIQEAIDKIPIQYTLGQYKHNSPTTKEQIYYRDLFEKYYTGIGNIIPYFWMPKYLKATDPSARTLQLYYECNPELEERAI